MEAEDEVETVEAEIIDDEDPADEKMPEAEKDIVEQLKEMYGTDE